MAGSVKGEVLQRRGINGGREWRKTAGKCWLYDLYLANRMATMPSIADALTASETRNGKLSPPSFELVVCVVRLPVMGVDLILSPKNEN